MRPVEPVTAHSPTPVVVGIDGSSASTAALRWSLREAGRRGGRLTVVCARGAADHGPAPSAPESLDTGDGLPSAREILAAAERIARAADPSVVVSPEVLDGPAESALVRRSIDTGLLVVGRRGAGGFRRLLLGSTAARVAAHARCPVVVVPEHPDEPESVWPGVVLGVGGCAEGEEAVAWAFDAAARAGRPLTAVRAWNWLADGPGLSDPLRDTEDNLAEQQRVLSEAIAGYAGKYPDVRVFRRVAAGHPASVILDTARDADLVVVGAHGTGAFARAFLGSIGDALIRHARCPVVIVR